MVTRIRQLLEYKQLSPTQFADLIGVGRPVMSHILSERNKPSLEVAQRIGSAFSDISLAWLMFGTGQMLAAEAASLSAAPAPVGESTGDWPASEPPLAPASLAEPTPPITSNAAPEASAHLPRPVEARPAPAPVLPLEALPRPFSISQPVPAAVLEPAALPEPASALEVASAVPPPFRAARFVPAAQAALTPTPESAVPPAAPVASPQPVAAPPAALPAPVLPPVPATAAAVASSEATMLPFLTESGKAIRRIVIFYRDGSFADYQPE